MTFTLDINIGNDAMQSSDDLAAALRRIADQLETYPLDHLFSDGPGRIHDLNGNTVGRYWLYMSEQRQLPRGATR